MSLEIDLKGKIVIVTGASSGIGAGIKRMMERAGAIVERCDITGHYGAATVDVTDTAALKAFVQFIVEKRGGIYIVVSCAGENIFGGAAACTGEEWQHNMQLNLTAHWQLAKLYKPYLEQHNNGVIIIIASNHAFASIPGCFPYNVTKTALIGLVRSLAIEWGPAIRTVGIAPGFIDTLIFLSRAGTCQYYSTSSGETAGNTR